VQVALSPFNLDSARKILPSSFGMLRLVMVFVRHFIASLLQIEVNFRAHLPVALLLYVLLKNILLC